MCFSTPECDICWVQTWVVPGDSNVAPLRSPLSHAGHLVPNRRKDWKCLDICPAGVECKSHFVQFALRTSVRATTSFSGIFTNNFLFYHHHHHHYYQGHIWPQPCTSLEVSTGLAGAADMTIAIVEWRRLFGADAARTEVSEFIMLVLVEGFWFGQMSIVLFICEMKLCRQSEPRPPCQAI